MWGVYTLIPHLPLQPLGDGPPRLWDADTILLSAPNNVMLNFKKLRL